jgi:hypothetical protein
LAQFIPTDINVRFLILPNAGHNFGQFFIGFWPNINQQTLISVC